jgi:hypothetical protein
VRVPRFPKAAGVARAALLLLLAAGTPALAAGDGPWRSPNVLSAEGRSPLTGQVESLAWLAGRWVGAGLGGQAEYVYSPPAAGTMMAAFRHARDGAVGFYEFIVIGEFEGRTALRLKHFHPDLTGWEAQDDWVEFPLLQIDAGKAAYFDGLTYRLDDDGRLEAFVIARSGEGPERELAFHLRRVGSEDTVVE